MKTSKKTVYETVGVVKLQALLLQLKEAGVSAYQLSAYAEALSLQEALPQSRAEGEDCDEWDVLEGYHQCAVDDCGDFIRDYYADVTEAAESIYGKRPV
jgi:hypothetical protein